MRSEPAPPAQTADDAAMEQANVTHASDRSDLVLELLFENNVADSSPRSQRCTAVGEMRFAQGSKGPCAVFDGKNHLDTGLRLAELGDTFTIECWAKPAETQREWGGIFGDWSGQRKGLSLNQRSGQTNHFTVVMELPQGRWDPEPLALDAEKWHHVALVKTLEESRLLLNGVVMAALRDKARVSPSTTTLLVGKGGSRVPNFQGEVSQFRVWKRGRAGFQHAGIAPDEVLNAVLSRFRPVVTILPGASVDHSTPARLKLSMPEGLLPEPAQAKLGDIRVAVSDQWQDLRGVAYPEATCGELLMKQDQGHTSVFEVRAEMKPGLHTLTFRPKHPDLGLQNQPSETASIYVAPPVASMQNSESMQCFAAASAKSRGVLSLDGTWELVLDPNNVGLKERWYASGAVAGARAAPVPGVVDQVFPSGYEGVVWYWKQVGLLEPEAGGRVLLRFHAVDYFAQVWVNGQEVGWHEGGETPFTFDITHRVRDAKQNRVVVRVVAPRTKPVDGLVPEEIVLGMKKWQGAGLQPSWNAMGIWQPVEVLMVPRVRVQDIFVDAQWKDRSAKCEMTLRNDGEAVEGISVGWEVMPDRGGGTLASLAGRVRLDPGESRVIETFSLPDVREWSPDDPCLYRLTVRVTDGKTTDAQSVRFGFREFVFRDGYFRLNGRRFYPKSGFTAEQYPMGQHAGDIGLMRREVTLMKSMGFNMFRSINRGTHPWKLDLCDELGLLVYEEHYDSWLRDDNKRHDVLFDRSLLGVVQRDRNHPSVVMWGVLNETRDNPRFRHAVESLPLVRTVDPTRMIVLNSGRNFFDRDPSIGSLANPRVMRWEHLLGDEAPDAGRSDAKTGNPLLPGDRHFYCPRSELDRVKEVRSMGADSPKPLFLSEFGRGNQFDLFELIRKTEQAGHPVCTDALHFKAALEELEVGFKRWGLDTLYPTPSEMLKAGESHGARIREEDVDLVRSNPHIVGFSMTQWEDSCWQSAGVVTHFREPKPGMVDAMRRAWAPLRICAFVEPRNLYRGGQVKIDAAVVNEEVLTPGEYAVRLKILGPKGVVFERAYPFRQPKNEAPLTRAVCAETLVADWPAGRYTATFFFEQGASAQVSREFHIAEPLGKVRTPVPVLTLGKDANIDKWLQSAGIEPKVFDPAGSIAPAIMLLVAQPEEKDSELWQAVAKHVSGGAVAIVFAERVKLDRGKLRPLDFLPIGKGISLDGGIGGWQGLDCIIKPHPFFETLSSGGLMDDLTYYRGIPSWSWLHVGPHCAASIEPVVPCLASTFDRGHNTKYIGFGLMLMTVEHGRGKYVLSTLNLVDNLGKHPAADRILANILVSR